MYKGEEIKKCTKKIKIGITLSIIFFVVMMASLVAIGLNVNDNNSILLLVLSLLIMLIFGFLTIYFVIEYIHLPRIRRRFLKIINNASKIIIKGKVTSFDKQVTTSKYQKSYLIEVEENKESAYTLYSEDALNLQIDGTYKFVVCNNYVAEYEEETK